MTCRFPGEETTEVFLSHAKGHQHVLVAFFIEFAECRDF